MATGKSNVISIDSTSANQRGYIRTPEGIQITWHIVNSGILKYQAWGQIFESTTAVSLQDFPMPFAEKPNIIISAQDSGGAGWFGGTAGATAVNAGTVKHYRSTNAEAYQVITVIAIGRWK